MAEKISLGYIKKRFIINYLTIYKVYLALLPTEVPKATLHKIDLNDFLEKQLETLFNRLKHSLKHRFKVSFKHQTQHPVEKKYL